MVLAKSGSRPMGRLREESERAACVSERRPWFGQETEAGGEEERELGAKQRREVEERSGKRKGDQRLGKFVGRLQLKRE